MIHGFLPQIHGNQKLVLYGEQLVLDSLLCMIVFLIVVFSRFSTPCLHERTYEPIVLRQRKRSRLDIVFLQFKTLGKNGAP